MKINTTAVIFWAVLSLGFHIFGGNWMVGLFMGLFISLIVDLVGGR